MRAALRLFAKAQPARFLEAGSPTGLTGLVTHGTPRPTLIYFYMSTLEKLKQFPESSVYRTATENLTKHRLELVERVKPEGFEAWQKRIEEFFKKNPDAAERAGATKSAYGGREFYVLPPEEEYDEREVEWDGEDDTPALEGIRPPNQRKNQAKELGVGQMAEEFRKQSITLEPEPPLSVNQIHQLEADLGAGLIEEVIQVAEAENDLVDEMLKARCWEELEVKPPEGQWTYFERRQHNTMTQKP